MSISVPVPEMTPREPKTFNQLIEQLAMDMQTYDVLEKEQRFIQQQVELRDKKLNDIDLIDLEVALEMREQEVALNALERLILGRKSSNLNYEMQSLESNRAFYWAFSEYFNKKVEVIALAPDKEEIGAFTGHSSNLSYAGRSHARRVGNIETVNLDPHTGGFLNIRGTGLRKGFTYQAGPLVDRLGGYTPLFSVTELG